MPALCVTLALGGFWDRPERPTDHEGLRPPGQPAMSPALGRGRSEGQPAMSTALGFLLEINSPPAPTVQDALAPALHCEGLWWVPADSSLTGSICKCGGRVVPTVPPTIKNPEHTSPCHSLDPSLSTEASPLLPPGSSGTCQTGGVGRATMLDPISRSGFAATPHR